MRRCSSRIALLAQVRSQKLDPKLKDKIDAEVKTLRNQRLMAARELDMAVKTTKEKYADLATDAEVQKALASLGLTVKPSPHLGPSHEFHEIARFAEKIEKDLGRIALRTEDKGGAQDQARGEVDLVPVLRLPGPRAEACRINPTSVR